ncbi:MAG: isoprenylcysteine carboxylmethyltransferase family protein [Candidatus Latescibacterota bacterium]|nr:MAG: isoprenylcysteine carboxylmethyltransferase family protein [Candidatus Latescibacterota bacterium]
MRYILLFVFWVAWCVVHSAMISTTVVRFVSGRLGRASRFYRLFFNFIALATLVPIVLYGRSLQSAWAFRWSGATLVVPAILLAIGMALLVTGARHYDLLRFLGLRQLGESASGIGLTETGHLDTTGVLGVCRHPWYAGAIALLWVGHLDAARLVTNLILTSYLVAGTFLEERKLVAELGDEYREYQRRVPMLLPIGFLMKKSIT